MVINGLKYHIVEVNNKSEKLLLDELYHFGMCNHKEQVIYLMEDVVEQQKRRVLIHEITHCFLNAYGMYVKESYSVEELCEFVAYNSKQINDLADKYFKRK